MGPTDSTARGGSEQSDCKTMSRPRTASDTQHPPPFNLDSSESEPGKERIFARVIFFYSLLTFPELERVNCTDNACHRERENNQNSFRSQTLSSD